MIGWSWSDVCRHYDDRASNRSPIADVLRGARTQSEGVAVSRDGSLVSLVFELSPVGDGSGVLATVVHSTEFPGFNGIEPLGELHYEISSKPDQLGQLKRVWGTTTQLAGAHVGQLCHEALFGRQEPCPRCPVFDSSLSRTRVAVIPSNEQRQPIRTLVLRETSDKTIYVRSQFVNETLLSELMQAKITSLATNCGLSDREQEVLRHLVFGCTVEEIAQLLGISPRTVRFHQSNMLEKLGADSRLDLMRIIM